MSVKQYGFEIHPEFLDDVSVRNIINEIEALEPDFPKHGIRNAEKKLLSVNELVTSSVLRDKASIYLSSDPEVVRVILFDKNPEKNWLVTWHQDKTIAVSGKAEIPGWGQWTVKDGVYHVQPSLEILEDMITFRIHLDDTDEKNGCLKVIPGSHRLGILSRDEQDQIVKESPEYICSARSGDLLIMRPYILHSSSKGINPSHRRILHVEYSGAKLPKGLKWA
ncbi:phytanoyl-CoA dioxygenase family protein [Microbulbifer sp. TYP-18]|uniref:phytanoyl-CoA dioxygenase family protein n=1 Tax=Microbulbifer sp. TYP-18 TaxID=3230024 RepID=UPI0034C62296